MVSKLELRKRKIETIRINKLIRTSKLTRELQIKRLRKIKLERKIQAIQIKLSKLNK